jgi:uncharacterized protein (TIGR00297 family)
VAAGAAWAVLLLAFFLPATALSHWRRSAKDARTAAVVAKGETRDAWQVAANGGVFAALALGSLVAPADWWFAAAAGALAAATADTWATEVGTAVGGTPWGIATLAPVPPGTSGAVSGAGTLALCAGAIFLAGWAGILASSPRTFVAVALGGAGGAMVDTLAGAMIQERRWCPACRAPTERTRHACGMPTDHRGGVRGYGNDHVNLTSCIAGALIALAFRS